MPVVELNGIHINYEEHGNPDGTPILLTHAYAATLQMWQPQFDAWRDYRVIGWDMRGHGGTDSPPTQEHYTEKLTVEDMASLLRHLAIERAVIGGLSLGGYLSLEFQHALGAASPLLARIFNRRLEVGGAAETIAQVGWDPNHPYRAIWAPAWRMVADAGAPQRSRWQAFSGESGHVASPHYDDLQARWAAGETQPMAGEAPFRHLLLEPSRGDPG